MLREYGTGERNGSKELLLCAVLKTYERNERSSEEIEKQSGTTDERMNEVSE